MNDIGDDDEWYLKVMLLAITAEPLTVESSSIAGTPVLNACKA